MPQNSGPTEQDRPKARKRCTDLRVLLVDPSDELRLTVEQCAPPRRRMDLRSAKTIAEARVRLACGPVDVVFIGDRLPDGSGVELAQQLGKGWRTTPTVMITDQTNPDAAQAAVRAGVCDLLLRPVSSDQVAACFQRALSKQSRDQALTRRVHRLRRLCRKLNQARLDVSEQVDVLCNDLVEAYQELASQMQQIAASSEFGALVRDELDLELLLRRVLEFVLDKSGPTNAAIFLPASMDEFSLGGYVNYDCTAESADMLLEHLADVLAPKVAERGDLVHITSNEGLRYWIGDDAAYLADSELISFVCEHEDEALAVVAIFRDASEPFDPSLIEVCDAVAPLLAGCLARVIRVYHRHMPDPSEAGGDIDNIPF